MTFDGQQQPQYRDDRSAQDALAHYAESLRQPEPLPPTAGSRALSCVLAFVVGVVYGAIGTVGHVITITVLGAALPVGLVAALAGVLGILLGLRLVLDDRLAALCAAIGMIGVIALFSLVSAGGTLLITQGGIGLTWILAPVFIATIVVAWPNSSQKVGMQPVTAPTAAAEGRHEA